MTAERRRDDLVPLSDRAQRALERDDEEGQGDEGLREHHGGGRERDVDAQHLKGVPEQPPPPEGVEERDPADDRGQHERQQQQRTQHALPGEGGAREDERHRDAEEQAYGGGRS
jgi:hypothetical protein